MPATFDNLPEMEGCVWDMDYPPVASLLRLDGSLVGYVLEDADVGLGGHHPDGNMRHWRFPDGGRGDFDFDAAIRWITEQTGIKPVGSAK